MLADVERLNLNTVNVPIQVDIPNVTSTNMVINQAQKQQAIILIQELLKRNIQVIVEPFRIFSRECWRDRMEPK